MVADNARLRDLLDAAQRGSLDVQLAPVLDVDLDPSRQRLILDAGGRAGVRVGQSVIDAGGLLGQVIDVTPMHATVLLLTDPDHAVPVMIARNGVRLVAYGRGRSDTLALASIPLSSDIKVGDEVVTSDWAVAFLLVSRSVASPHCGPTRAAPSWSATCDPLRSWIGAATCCCCGPRPLSRPRARRPTSTLTRHFAGPGATGAAGRRRRRGARRPRAPRAPDASASTGAGSPALTRPLRRRARRARRRPRDRQLQSVDAAGRSRPGPRGSPLMRTHSRWVLPASVCWRCCSACCRCRACCSRSARTGSRWCWRTGCSRTPSGSAWASRSASAWSRTSTFGGLLGEQALRLVVMAFIVQRFRARLRFFPLSQQSLAIGGLLLNDRVIVGAAASGSRRAAPGRWSYWLAPVLGMVLWPSLFVLLDAAAPGPADAVSMRARPPQRVRRIRRLRPTSSARAPRSGSSCVCCRARWPGAWYFRLQVLAARGLRARVRRRTGSSRDRWCRGAG